MPLKSVLETVRFDEKRNEKNHTTKTKINLLIYIYELNIYYIYKSQANEQ